MKTKKTKTNRKILQILFSAIAICSTASVGFATEHTTRLVVDNDNVILVGGDTYTFEGAGAGIFATNDANINLAPSDSGITVNVSEVSGSMLVRGAVAAEVNSTIDLGSSSKVSVTAESTRTAIGLYARENSNVFATNVEINGYGRVTGATATVDSTINLGMNSIIRTGFTGVQVNQRGRIVASDAYIDAANTAINVFTGTVNLHNTTAIGGETVVNFFGQEAGATSESVAVVNFSGGSLYSTNGPVVQTNSESTAQVHDMILNITDGAQASSKNGVLYSQNATTVATTGIDFTLNVEGTGTKVEGAFLGDTVETNFNISDSATWKSTGASNMDNLFLDNANLEFDMTSISDSITTGNLTLEGHSEALIGFTNDFLEEIIAAGGSMNDIDASIVTSFLDGAGDITYTFKTSNDEGSTWDIVNHGDGTFDISNINIIPEPSTYAVIFGLLALAFATYRKRK